MLHPLLCLSHILQQFFVVFVQGLEHVPLFKIFSYALFIVELLAVVEEHLRYLHGDYGIVRLPVIGMFRLRSEGFIVDDLPKSDKIYTDMKFFEQNFKGVMPLEIVIDTKRKNGLRSNMLQTFEKIDSLAVYVSSQKEMARPLSIVEGMKFAKQAYYDGDSSNYSVPNSFDIAFLAQYLTMKGGDGSGNNFTKLVRSFMDSTRQQTRVSINMADVGSKRLQVILDTLENRTSQLFDTCKI